jgi:glyoxylase-like metal-dependent hydrolase (beta-lactamase superfamily II)
VTGLERISDHVYWLPPSPPDRPALGAVAGERRTLMLDAGASAAHARLFLDGLSAEGVAAPAYVAFTHSHWDHVFGAAEVRAHVIAQELTAETLSELAATDWTDEALDRRVAEGIVSPGHAENVKAELRSPREVQVAPADIVFVEGLDMDLGGVTVHIRHVGGDHAADSSVIYIEPDRVLFLGDCLYPDPGGGLTRERVFPLLDAVFAFGAELYLEGHGETVSPQAELEALAGKVRAAESFVRRGPPDEAGVLSEIREQTGQAPDEDMVWLVQAFLAAKVSNR